MTNELTAERLRELVAECDDTANHPNYRMQAAARVRLYLAKHADEIIALMERDARMKEALEWVAGVGPEELALSQTESSCRIIIRHMAAAACAAMETDDAGRK